MPVVSVILPAWNAEAYISDAVESVLKQRFADWELILVDDGSTDATGALCDAFAARDRRIRVLHKQNAGVSEARNDALAAAQGEWIAFLDADDVYTPDYLDVLLGAAQSTGADSAACGFDYVYPDGTSAAAPPPMAAGSYDADAAMRGFVLPLLCDRVSENLTLGTIWRCLFRRSAITEMGLRFSGAYLEDELFLIEYFASGKSLVCVEDSLYRYYQNPASATRNYQADFIETFTRTLGAKAALIARYSIPVPSFWKDNSAWAGLLIAAANLFAPGAPGGPSTPGAPSSPAASGSLSAILSRAKSLKNICAIPIFATAIDRYVPSGMNRNKRIVAALLRRRLYLALSALYTFKNRNR